MNDDTDPTPAAGIPRPTLPPPPPGLDVALTGYTLVALNDTALALVHGPDANGLVTRVASWAGGAPMMDVLNALTRHAVAELLPDGAPA